jgi:integrase
MSARTVNAEIGVLRQILKHFVLWTHLADRVRFMRERRDTGRALTTYDESRLIEAVGKSRSPVLLPLFVTALDTGLRASELRNLRHSDLHAVWKRGTIQTGEIVVSRSKIEGGTGRIVPLTSRARAALSLWLSRFPEAQPDSFVFPHRQIGFAGDSRLPYVYDIDLTIPISEWKSAWTAAREAASLNYRWHDLRHTFITRLAENPSVSEQTITALAGHVSKRMLERYSHVRTQAKRDAIASLDKAGFEREGAQDWAQSKIGQENHSAV